MFDGNDTFYIENDGSRNHFLIKHADLQLDHKCGHEDGSNHTKHGAAFNRVKRSVNDNQVRGPYNSNAKSNYVELVIVVDNQAYNDFGRDTRKVHKHCKDIVNIINAVRIFFS